MSKVTLYRQKKDNVELPTWWLYYRKDGKTFRKSTGTSDPGEAEKARAQMERLVAFDKREELTEDFYRATRSLDRQETSIKEFFEHARDTVTSPSTRGEYQLVDKGFLSFVSKSFPNLTLLHEIKPSHLEMWHRDLVERLRPRTVNKHVKVLRMAFKKALRSNVILRNPAENIELLKVSESARRPFTIEELKLICAKAKGFFRYSAALGLYTGARLGDICQLKWRDIDFTRACISYRMQKLRGKIMEVPMHSALAMILKELAGKKSPNPNDYLFPAEAVRYTKHGSSPLSTKWLYFLARLGMIERGRAFYRKRAKLRKAGKTVPSLGRTPGELSFHSFRHTATTLLKSIGAPQAVAMQIVGHESASISKIYTHLDESTERRWIDKMPDFRRLAFKPKPAKPE